MQPSNRIWYLMARSFSRETTQEELDELFLHLQNDAALSQQYDILSRLWKNPEDENDDKILEEDRQHIARILQLAKSTDTSDNTTGIIYKLRRRRLFVRAAIAGAFILLFAAGIWWQNKNKSSATLNQPYKIIATQNGNRTKTILPDGTNVWLNSGSTISYDPNFNGVLREVKLQGEAYFDVVKNPRRPFIVHTAGIDIRVLGTAFNVKSYPDDKTVETTLIRGLVQVTRDNDSKEKPIILHPNQKLIVEKIAVSSATAILANNHSQQIVQPQIPYKITALDSNVNEDAHLETAWLYNRLAFRGDNFKELAQKLERWYNVHIFFEDEKVKQLNFNGSFENETVQQAFAALKSATPFNYKINDNEIFISSSK